MIILTFLLFTLSEVIFVSGSLKDLTDYDKWASPDPTKPTEIFIRTQIRHVNTVDLAQEIFDIDLSIQLRFSFNKLLEVDCRLVWNWLKVGVMIDWITKEFVLLNLTQFGILIYILLMKFQTQGNCTQKCYRL